MWVLSPGVAPGWVWLGLVLWDEEFGALTPGGGVSMSCISKRGVLKLYLLQTTPPFYKDSGKDGHFTMLGAPGVTCQDPQLTHSPSSPDPSLLSNCVGLDCLL